MKKNRCPICYHYLEEYPNSGAPLTDKQVCLCCNNKVIIPYRYFLATYESNASGLLITKNQIRVIAPSDGIFKRSDIEVLLQSSNINIKRLGDFRLVVAYLKENDLILDDLNSIAYRAVSGAYFQRVLVIPIHILEGGIKLNE